MDVSLEYIKMCEKAEEIQELELSTGVSAGDFVYTGEQVIVWCRVCKRLDIDFKQDTIWLPRQDQLQEMVPTGENLEAFHVGHGNQMRYQLGQFTQDYGLDYTNQFTSMEQLWLAFCMSEKYNKIWDGEIWQ